MCFANSGMSGALLHTLATRTEAVQCIEEKSCNMQVSTIRTSGGGGSGNRDGGGGGGGFGTLGGGGNGGGNRDGGGERDNGGNYGGGNSDNGGNWQGGSGQRSYDNYGGYRSNNRFQPDPHPFPSLAWTKMP